MNKATEKKETQSPVWDVGKTFKAVDDASKIIGKPAQKLGGKGTAGWEKI